MANGLRPDGGSEMALRQELGELFSRGCEMGFLILVRGQADKNLVFCLSHNACKDTIKRGENQI